ncbi:MAG: PKD domain-containing protein [Salibacteraceae bacterium]
MKAIKTKLSVISLVILSLGLAFVSCKKPPRANFTYEISNGGLVQFTNTTGGKFDRILWSFGDTNSSDETNPLHRYLKSGVYEVELEIENGDGSDTKTEVVTIREGSRENLEDHPRFNDADGYFYARNTLEFEEGTPTIYNNIRGSAIAALYDSTDFLVYVGRVSVNGILLTNNSDNSYSLHSPDSTLYFKDQTRWTADGGSGYLPVVENTPKDFPIIQGIIPDTFSIKYDTTYTLKMATQVRNADSVIWIIENSQGFKIAEKRTTGGFSGVQFVEDELSGITTQGTYITKVVAYSFIRKTNGFKVLYYTKESFTQSSFTVNK